MGLDMHAYKLKQELVKDEDQVDVPVHRLAMQAVGFQTITSEQFSALPDDQREDYWSRRDKAQSEAVAQGIVDFDFAYWRKFNHLHGWMERLYEEKGGKEQFNCTTVRLMPEDLDRLERDILGNKLTATQGFFFGGDTLYPEDVAETVAFIENCRQAYLDGYAVLYDSWW